MNASRVGMRPYPSRRTLASSDRQLRRAAPRSLTVAPRRRERDLISGTEFRSMNSVKSAARVLDILELLFRSEEPMALKDIVSILSLPKSSAHALMRTLQSRGYVEVIAKSVSRAQIRYDSDNPGLRPAYCTGMGRVLLAFWDKKWSDAYLMRTRLRTYTPKTVTDAGKLRAILAKVVAQGYA